MSNSVEPQIPPPRSNSPRSKPMVTNSLIPTYSEHPMKSVTDKHERETGFEVAWLNLTYSVKPNILEDPRWGHINSLFHKQPRTILQQISGGIKSGQLIALMGPSGAGKTCLLECLAGVRTSGIEGKLLIRGQKQAKLCIVPQLDNFMLQFTVEEIIEFGSKVRNPPDADHKKLTDQVIHQLGLQACRYISIKKCSGGQRKRTAIAQELVSRPNILLLDEPTSGLDSSCCYQTMSVLKEVLNESAKTDQPMAIIMTIHQPSAKVFNLFDEVYLLAKSGQTAYSGPPNKLMKTIQEVAGLKCPRYSNPADFMIEIVSYDYGEESIDRLVEFERLKCRKFVTGYENRVGPRRQSNVAEKIEIFSKLNSPNEQGSNKCDTSNSDKLNKSNNGVDVTSRDSADLFRSKPDHVYYKNNESYSLRIATDNSNKKHPFLWHSQLHMKRSFLQSVRNPVLNNMRILIHLWFGLMLIGLYGKNAGTPRGCPPVLGLPTEITDPNHESLFDLADNVGYMFMCLMMITYVSLMSTVLTFPIDIKTVGKEYKNGWYSTTTYFIGKTIADLPFFVVYPLFYSAITWYLTDQPTDHHWRFVSYFSLITMNAMNSQSFGLVLGSVFVNSVTAATFLGPVITNPLYLFTGFTKRVHKLPKPLARISDYLFTRIIYEGLLDTTYGHSRCNCTDFINKYQELRYEEAIRLGQLISPESLASLDYYDGLSAVANFDQNSTGSRTDMAIKQTVDAASNFFAEDSQQLNLASLVDSNVKKGSLFSFGLDFEPTCPADYKSYVMQDFRLSDDSTYNGFIFSIISVAVIRVMTYVLVTWRIRTRQL